MVYHVHGAVESQGRYLLPRQVRVEVPHRELGDALVARDVATHVDRDGMIFSRAPVPGQQYIMPKILWSSGGDYKYGSSRLKQCRFQRRHPWISRLTARTAKNYQIKDPAVVANEVVVRAIRIGPAI